MGLKYTVKRDKFDLRFAENSQTNAHYIYQLSPSA
jgi:hypothetical protein